MPCATLFKEFLVHEKFISMPTSLRTMLRQRLQFPKTLQPNCTSLIPLFFVFFCCASAGRRFVSLHACCASGFNFQLLRERLQFPKTLRSRWTLFILQSMKNNMIFKMCRELAGGKLLYMICI